MEDRAGNAEEVDDPGEVPLPGVLVAEHVDRHRRRVFVEPAGSGLVSRASGGRKNQAIGSPKARAKAASSATSMTRWRREVNVFSIAESPAAVIGRPSVS